MTNIFHEQALLGARTRAHLGRSSSARSVSFAASLRRLSRRPCGDRASRSRDQCEMTIIEHAAKSPADLPICRHLPRIAFPVEPVLR